MPTYADSGTFRPRTSQTLSSSLLSPMNRPSLASNCHNSSFIEEARRSRKRNRRTQSAQSSVNESARLLSTPTTGGTNFSSRRSSQSSISSATQLSDFDKKVQLTSDEIDRIGFGKYQWQLFFVCGSGWLLDLLWAHAFGLALPAIQHELGFAEQQYGYLSTGFSIGMTLGALTWGVLLDIVGRRAAFNYTVAISSVFGICTGFCSSYTLLVVLAAGVGFGVGGNIPVDTTIFLEFIPQENRTMLVIMSIFQPLGSILSTLIAWAVIPSYSCAPDLESCNIVNDPATECCSRDMNMGWRYMFYSISAITLLIFGLRFVVFTMFESPAFLLSHNKDSEALDVIHKVATVNGTRSTLSFEEISTPLSYDEESDSPDSNPLESKSIGSLIARQLSTFNLSHLQLLFKSQYSTRLTLLTWLIYAADFWGFTLSGVFLPKILLQKGAKLHTSVSDTYLTYILIATSGIPGALVSMYLVSRKISRRWVMAMSSAGMAISLFLFATVTTRGGNLAFNAVEYFCQTIFNAVLYAWTPEVFEGSVRGSATGIAAFWGRLVSIVAPIIGSAIFAAKGGGNNVLFAAGGGTLVATVAIFLLP